jgi:outer membrane protein
MKKHIKHISLALFMALLTLPSLNAQKFGHLNSRVLLMEMPEIKSADSQLETYQKQLMTKGEGMVKKFEAKYNTYVTAANEGTLSALEMQKKESELKSEQTAIQEYELEMQDLLGKKREQLYKPLLDKVKLAIEKIGKDNGYTMIFDTSVAGAIVHAETSEDIMNLVKKELGLN